MDDDQETRSARRLEDTLDRQDMKLAAIETTVTDIVARLNRSDATVAALVAKLEQLVANGIRFAAIGETLLVIAKVFPFVVTFLSVLAGAIIWLIKHA